MSFTFAWGVADIYALARLAVKVSIAYQEAPEDYKHISQEVESLHILVSEGIRHFKNDYLSESKQREGRALMQGCKSVLEDLDSVIEKYKSLASPSEGGVIMRLRFKTEDIATLRSRLISITNLLSNFVLRFVVPVVAPFDQSTSLGLLKLLFSHRCELFETEARLTLNLRCPSRLSVASETPSINTKRAFKEFFKDLSRSGVTADMISCKGSEIIAMFGSQNTTLSNQNEGEILLPIPADDTSTDSETSPAVNQMRPRLSWARLPMDRLLELTPKSTKRSISEENLLLKELHWMCWGYLFKEFVRSQRATSFVILPSTATEYIALAMGTRCQDVILQRRVLGFIKSNPDKLQTVKTGNGGVAVQPGSHRRVKHTQKTTPVRKEVRRKGAKRFWLLEMLSGLPRDTKVAMGMQS